MPRATHHARVDFFSAFTTLQAKFRPQDSFNSSATDSADNSFSVTCSPGRAFARQLRPYHVYCMRRAVARLRRHGLQQRHHPRRRHEQRSDPEALLIFDHNGYWRSPTTHHHRHAAGLGLATYPFRRTCANLEPALPLPAMLTRACLTLTESR
jgi:hypothetical protein